MNKFLSQYQTDTLATLSGDLDFNTKEQLTRIEDLFYNNIVVSKDKYFLVMTSLPFIYGNNSDGFDGHILDELWPLRCNICKDVNVSPGVKLKLDVPCGNLQPNIFIIGEAPGFSDKDYGVNNRMLSFGVVSNYIKIAMFKLNLNHLCWYTNIIKCQKYNNEPIKKLEILNCKSKLDKELELLKPKYIFILGNNACEAFKKYYDYNNYTVIKLYHPAYFFRRRFNVNDYFEHVKEKVGGIANEIIMDSAVK